MATTTLEGNGKIGVDNPLVHQSSVETRQTKAIVGREWWLLTCLLGLSFYCSCTSLYTSLSLVHHYHLLVQCPPTCPPICPPSCPPTCPPSCPPICPPTCPPTCPPPLPAANNAADCPTQLICAWIFHDKAKRTEQGNLLRTMAIEEG